jgi:hypothetical protein
MRNSSNVIAECKCIRQIHQKFCVTKGFITLRRKGSHSFDINYVYFLRFWKIIYFGIRKNAINIRLGTGLFALGMPPFPGGADSAEKPLLSVDILKYFMNNLSNFAASLCKNGNNIFYKSSYQYQY